MPNRVDNRWIQWGSAHDEGSQPLTHGESAVISQKSTRPGLTPSDGPPDKRKREFPKRRRLLEASPAYVMHQIKRFDGAMFSKDRQDAILPHRIVDPNASFAPGWIPRI